MKNLKKILLLAVGLSFLYPYNPTSSKNFFKKILKVAKNPLLPSKKTPAEKLFKKAKQAVIALQQMADINLKENFHTVKKGILYRSRQPSRAMLDKYKEEYKIKTIINLRGKNEGEDWFEEEVQAAQDLELDLYHIPMSAKKYPSKKNLRKLIKLLNNPALWPILIHCRGGADRSGEAAAVFLLLQSNGKHKSKALDQLSLFYGHKAWEYPLKRKFISKWVDTYWALNIYDPNNL